MTEVTGEDAAAFPTVDQLARAFMEADYARRVVRPHCIDCAGNGGHPNRTHPPSGCFIRPREPQWPTKDQRFYARVVVDVFGRTDT